MSECRMCRNRGQTWNGSAPKCAFEGGRFSTDNWNCATMNALRSIAKAVGLNYRDDNCAASIGAVPYEGREEGGGYIVMTWYKDRGRTGMAQLMCDDSEPEPLTLEMAEDAVWFYTQGYGRNMLTDDWRWQDDRRGQSDVVAMLDEFQAQAAREIWRKVDAAAEKAPQQFKNRIKKRLVAESAQQIMQAATDALARLDARAGEDVDAWAERLGRDIANVGKIAQQPSEPIAHLYEHDYPARPAESAQQNEPNDEQLVERVAKIISYAWEFAEESLREEYREKARRVIALSRLSGGQQESTQ